MLAGVHGDGGGFESRIRGNSDFLSSNLVASVAKEGDLMSDKSYEVIAPKSGVPIKTWTKGVALEEEARRQLMNVAQLQFVYRWSLQCRMFTGVSEQR